MKDINYVFDQLKQSHFILVGYRNEMLKSQFISKLSFLEIEDLDTDIRNYKINKILTGDGYNFEYLLVDLDTIIPDLNLKNHSKHINSILSFMSKGSILKSKVIFLSRIHEELVNKIPNFKGGTSLMYRSDLIITLNDDKIKIVKNRNGEDFSIDTKNLKNYSYICNYEHS